MSSRGIAHAQLLLGSALMGLNPAMAQAQIAGPDIPAPVTEDAPPPVDTVDQALVNARRFARIRSLSDCLAERRTTSDIVVCGAGRDDGLPLDDNDQGVADDLASDPYAQSVCGEGVRCSGNVLRAIGFTAQLIGYLFDPDGNLSGAARIPERFRGANR